MSKQRKFKQVTIGILALFMAEVIIVTFFSSNSRVIKNKVYSSDKKNKIKNNSMPIGFTKYFTKYTQEMEKNKNYKSAIALALDSSMSWTGGYSFSYSQYEANRKALISCKRGLTKYKVQSQCVIYAEGLNIVYNQKNKSSHFQNKTSKRKVYRQNKLNSRKIYNPIKYKVVKIRSNDTLNVRKEAGVYNKKIGQLAYNARNIELQWCKNISNGEKWCKISHPTARGWVSAKYIRKEYTSTRKKKK